MRRAEVEIKHVTGLNRCNNRAPSCGDADADGRFRARGVPIMSLSSSLSRRGLIAGGAAIAAAAVLPAWAASGAAFPFTLGVASGDPAPDGFVLWTRLAPDPLAADGRGGIAGPVPVRWEIAADEGMSRILRSGVVRADDRFAHSVHVEVAGLRPGRPYWYRFTAQGHQSPVGLARTAPAPGQAVDRLRIAAASCAHWELGWFSAYRHMAADAPDLVFFLGDYIYEYSNGAAQADKVVRRHDRQEALTDLVGYRNRYALHRTDPDLQALHHAAPCIATWDDHEVENDYANRWSTSLDVTPESFLRRRAAAYQAFYEHMPLRRMSLPHGPDMRVYRRLRFGRLAEFAVMDGRQYRTIQPCPTPTSRRGHVAAADCPDLFARDRTMLGSAQERWLYDGFRRASATWNVMAQDLLVAPLLQKDPKTGIDGYYTDGWQGYVATRDRMLTAVAESRLPNPVFLGGDIHSFWTTDLKARPDGPTVATEFVGTSITSDGPPYDTFAGILPQNPHVRFFDSRERGYMLAEITPERMQTDFRAISDRRDPKATVSTLKRFVVEAGKAGAVEA